MITIVPDILNDMVEEVKRGLPSPLIMQYASSVAIKIPNTDEIIMIKYRYPHIPIENQFVVLKDRKTWDANWSHIGMAHVLIDYALLSEESRNRFFKLAAYWGLFRK